MRKFIILFLLLCSVCWPASIKLGIWTDTHIRLTEGTPGNPFGDLPGKRLPGYQDSSMGLAVANFNAASVDLVIHVGDMINNAADGTVVQNYAELVSWVDGNHALSDGLTTPSMLYCFGHWDIGGSSITGTTIAAAFTGLSSGVTDIIPAGRNADMWWPDGLSPDVANDTYCAYRFDDNGFMIIVLCTPSTIIDMTTTGRNGAETQQQWFQGHLTTANGAGTPVIVVTHTPFYTTRVEPVAGGSTAAISAMEAQTIKPIVIQAHIHVYDTVEVVNGIPFINFRGDLWGIDENDTGRFSHAILEIEGPLYNDINGSRCSVNLTGYGHQRSKNMTKALVGHWKLDETDGTAAAGDAIVDSSGNGYHGTNSETVISVSSPIGHGISLDGTGDYIDDTAQPLLAFPCSLSVWYKISQIQTSTLFGISNKAGTGATARLMVLHLQAGNPRMVVKGASGIASNTPASSTGAIYDEWVFVVGVWVAADDKTIYVNGKVAGTDSDDTQIFPDTADTITIGAKSANNTQAEFFTGDLSDARVYSGALSANDVATLYRAGTTGLRDRYSVRKKIGLRGRRRY